MSQSVVGVNDFTEQPEQQKRTRGSDWTTIRTWIGPRALVDAFLESTVNVLNPSEVILSKGTPCIITATIPEEPTSGVQQLEDEAVWELVPSPLDKPLATHPSFQGYVPPGQTWAIAVEKIELALRKGVALEQDWGIEARNSFAKLRAKGVTSWRTWQWIIRKTITVGSQTDLQSEEVNTQKIVGYNEIGIPTTVKWAQPKYRRWDGATATEVPIAEWMATPPTIKYTRRKYDVTKEWIGAVKWYGILYEGGSATPDEDGI